MNVDLDKVMRCVNFLISASSMYQSSFLHGQEVRYQKDLSEAAIKESKRLHNESIKLNKKTYLVDLFISLEQHFQQLNADLVGSSKESQRDMFDQRNQQLQTIILSSSVMFSALSTIIIQGPLNEESSLFLVMSYSLVCSLSFGSLFITIVICIEIVMRASRFMYRKSVLETNHLRRAVDNTKGIIKVIRNKALDDVLNSSTTLNTPMTSAKGKRGSTFSNSNSNGADRGNTLIPSINNLGQQELVELVNMPDHEINRRWDIHEKAIHEILRRRDEFIVLAADLLYDDNSTTGGNGRSAGGEGYQYTPATNGADPLAPRSGYERLRSFDTFWNENCQFWSDLATLTFYIGTLTLLTSVMIFMWSEFDFTYNSESSSILAVVIIGVSLIVGVVLGLSLRFNYFRSPSNSTPQAANAGATPNQSRNPGPVASSTLPFLRVDTFSDNYVNLTDESNHRNVLFSP